MKKVVTVAILIMFAATSALAVDGGNPRKGKYLFKKSCKVCHVDGGEGELITPIDKTMNQWDKFFKKGHNPVYIEGMSEKDLLDINQYLFDHAADSDQPETCG